MNQVSGDSNSYKEKSEKLDLEKKEQSNTFRTKLFDFILKTTACYLILVLLILVFAGFGTIFSFNFELETAVLVSLITTVPVNLIGLVVIVTKALFPIKE